MCGHAAPNTVTLHLLRRSGALASVAHGATITEVMAHGTWRSAAVHAYAPRTVTSNIPHILASQFGV